MLMSRNRSLPLPIRLVASGPNGRVLRLLRLGEKAERQMQVWVFGCWAT
jgi:hypothetical protein